MASEKLGINVQASIGNETIYEDIQIGIFEISGIFLGTVSVLGLVGNILIICAFCRKGRQGHSVNVILIGLAISDILILFCLFGFLFLEPTHSPHIWRNLTWRSHNYYLDISRHYLRVIFRGLFFTGVNGNALCTLGISAERYLAVCYPLRSRSWCTWKNARYFVLAVYLYSLHGLSHIAYYSLDISILFEWIESENSNFTSQYYIFDSGFSPSHFRLGEIFSLILPGTQTTIVAILLGYFNFAIYSRVMESNKERAVMTQEQKKTLNLTNTLSLVVLLYIIANTPRMIYVISHYIFGYKISAVSDISPHCFCINSATNFYIYCMRGKTFRNEVLQMIRPVFGCGGKAENPRGVVT